MIDRAYAHSASMAEPPSDSSWDRLHAILSWLAIVCALLVGFWRRDGFHPVAAAAWGLMCGAGIAFARALRPAILDITAQFQYREKFGLLLVHMGLLLVPRLLGFRDFIHGFALLLAVMCLQSVSRAVWGRIHAMTFAIALPSLFLENQPPFVFVVAWLASLLLAYRGEFIAFRLRENSHAGGLPWRDAIRDTFIAIVPPLALSALLYLACAPLLAERRRTLAFSQGPSTPSARMGPISMSDILFDAAVIVGLVIALIALIYWMERLILMIRPGKGASGSDEPAVFLSQRKLEPKETEGPRFDFGHGPRALVLERFSRFCSAIGRDGWGRGAGETATEYLQRLAKLLKGADAPPAAVAATFERACYTSAEMSEGDAREFLAAADALEPQLLQEILRRAPSTETPENTTAP